MLYIIPPEADHLPGIYHPPAAQLLATSHCPSHHVVGQVLDCSLLLCVYDCVNLSHQQSITSFQWHEGPSTSKQAMEQFVHMLMCYKIVLIEPSYHCSTG